MTWAKFGVEYRGQLMNAGLSDAAARTHTEALLWLYEIESAHLLIPKRLTRTIFGSAGYEMAITELVAAGFWLDYPVAYEVIHHADVFRQSLAAQLLHREKEKNRQRQKRGSGKPKVGTNVGANVRATQTDRQSTKTEGQVPNGTALDDDRDSSGAEHEVREREARAEEILTVPSAPEATAAEGGTYPPAPLTDPRPGSANGPATVVHDDQQIPANVPQDASLRTVTRASSNGSDDRAAWDRLSGEDKNKLFLAQLDKGLPGDQALAEAVRLAGQQ